MAFASSTPAILGDTEGGGSDYATDFPDSDRPEAVEGTEMIYSGGNYHLPIPLSDKESQKTDSRKLTSVYTPTERTSAMSFKAPTSPNKKLKQQEATSSMSPFQNVSSYFTNPIKYIASAFYTPTSESEAPLKPGGSKKAAWKQEKTPAPRSRPTKYPEISGTERDSTAGKSLVSEDVSLERIKSMKAIDYQGQVAAPNLLDRALAKNKNRSAIVNLSEESFSTSTKTFTDDFQRKARYEAIVTPQPVNKAGGSKKQVSPVRKSASPTAKKTGRKASASSTSVKSVQNAISASNVKFEMVNRSSYRIVSTSSPSRFAQNIIQSSKIFQDNQSCVKPANAALLETEGQPFPLCVPAIGPQQISTTLMSRKRHEISAAPILPLAIETPHGNSFDTSNYVPPTILPSFSQERINSTGTSSMHNRSNSASTKSPSPSSLTVKRKADTIQSTSPNKALSFAFSPKDFSAPKPSKIPNNGRKSPSRKTVPAAGKGQVTAGDKHEKSKSEYKYPRLVAVLSPPKPAAITPAVAQKSPPKTDVKLSSDPTPHLSPKVAKRSPLTIKKHLSPPPKLKSPIENKPTADGAHSLVVSKSKSPPQPTPQSPQVSAPIRSQSPDYSAAIVIATSTAIAAAATKLEEFCQKSPPSPFSDREKPVPPPQPCIPDPGTVTVSESPTWNVLPSPAAPSANSAQTKPPNSLEAPILQLPPPISPPLSASVPNPPASNRSPPVRSQMSPTSLNIGSKLPAPNRHRYQSAISVMENSCSINQYSANPLYFASAATMMGELP